MSLNLSKKKDNQIPNAYSRNKEKDIVENDKIQAGGRQRGPRQTCSLSVKDIFWISVSLMMVGIVKSKRLMMHWIKIRLIYNCAKNEGKNQGIQKFK